MEIYGPDPAVCPTHAAEYFRSFAEGRYDDFAHLGYIYPASKARLSEDGQILVIGTAGVDGLEFAYRAEIPGIWVWYPLDGEWRQVAADIKALDRDWRSRALRV